MPGHLQRSVECRRDWHRFQWISLLAVFPITGIFVNKINNFRRATSWRVLVLNRHPARRGTSPVVTEGRDRDRSSLKIERIIKSRLGDSGSVPSWSSFCKIALGARRVRFVARMLKASATGSFCETELGQNRLSHISVHTVYRRPITIKPQPGAARFVTREFTNQVRTGIVYRFRGRAWRLRRSSFCKAASGPPRWVHFVKRAPLGCPNDPPNRDGFVL